MSVRYHIPLRLVCAPAVLALTGPAHAFGPTPGRGVLPLCPPRPAGALIAGTAARDVEVLVQDFVRAYNAGDMSRLEVVFAPEPDFEWYSVDGERMRGAARDRSTLVPYFASRHRLGDRVRLLALRVNDERSWHGGYDFSFELRRTSRETPARGRYHGKGAAGCTIYTWSMGRAR